jgi:hypothetical protein
MSLRKVPFGFAPISITGCQLWLDGADSSTISFSSGSNISQWRDKSGNTRHMGVGSGTTSYSSSAIKLNNSYMYVTSAVNLINVTVFIVVKTTSGHNQTVFEGRPNTNVDYNSLDGFGFYMDDTTGIRFYGQQSSGMFSTFSVDTSTPRLFSFKSTGTSVSGWYQGVSQSGGTLSSTRTSTAQGFAIGAYWSGSTYDNIVSNASLYEIIVYNSDLTDNQRQQVESYLAQKWGLNAFLSVGHPGLTTTVFKADYIKNSAIIRNSARPIPYFAAFSPRQIPGLGLWLDAADSSTVTGTTPITGWTDKSGNGRTVTITSGPTYGTTSQGGNRTMVFNNNTITTSIASAVGTGDFTLIAVWYQSSAGTNTVLSLGTVASSSQSLGFSGNKYNFYQFGDVNESAYSASTPSWVVQIGTRIGSVKKVYINGNLGTTPSSTSYDVSVTTVTIGKGDNFAITGEIGEIMIYTGTMSDTSRQSLESYLAQKWSLTASLPGGHSHLTQRAGAITTVANTKFSMVGVRRAITATGGTVTTSGGFRIHSFTSIGTTNFVLTSPSSITAQVLVVAGGGAGGYDDGGGGGAGGVIYNAAFTITSGTYGVVVGNGGTSNGASGGNSVLSSLTAVGGGGGANGNGNGSTGGSGGGIGWGVANGSTPGSGTAGQGFAGGSGTTAPNYAVGGGGGAGGVGGTGSGITPGNGGIGVSHTIAGTTYNVGGGGGGGLAVQNTNGTNSTASFGGGNGAGRGSSAAVAGSPNTGGGGGGANNMQAPNGAFGGTGLVIIAYSI